MMALSFLETKRFYIKDQFSTVSLGFSMLILFLFLALFIILFIHNILVHNMKWKTDKSIFSSLYDGIKPKMWARAYYLIFMVRRMSMVLTYTLMSRSKNINQMVTVILITISYYGYLLLIRPHISVKDNICEVLNESSFTTLVTLLAFYNTKKGWSDKGTLASVLVFMLSVMLYIVMGITMVYSLVTYYKKIR